MAPLVSAFEMKNPSLRVGNIIIHRKHARMCGFHYGTPMEPQWKLYEPNGNDEIIESSCFLKLWQLNGHYFQVFENSIVA